MIRIIGYSADEEAYFRHGGKRSQSKRRYIPKRSQLRTARRQYCCYCKCQLDETNYTIEHLLPIDKGGKNGKYNLRPCCFICNQDKACLLLEEWLLVLQQRTLCLFMGTDDYKRNQRRIAKVIRLIASDDYKTALSRKNLTNLSTQLF